MGCLLTTDDLPPWPTMAASEMMEVSDMDIAAIRERAAKAQPHGKLVTRNRYEHGGVIRLSDCKDY